MRIAICDDRIQDRKSAIQCLQDIKIDCIFDIFEFENGESILLSYKNGNYFDIIFLDVEMDKLSGIDVGVQIRKHHKKAIIIFVSSYSQYAIPAYDCEPLYFITKPIEKERFFEVFSKAINKYKLTHQYYILQSKGQAHRIPIHEILYVEIRHKHVMFFTKTKTFETTQSTLKDVFKILQPHGFIQVHQAILVNPTYIKSIQDLSITLNNNIEVIMSVRKKASTLKAYADFLEGEI